MPIFLNDVGNPIIFVLVPTLVLGFGNCLIAEIILKKALGVGLREYNCDSKIRAAFIQHMKNTNPDTSIFVLYFIAYTFSFLSAWLWLLIRSKTGR